MIRVVKQRRTWPTIDNITVCEFRVPIVGLSNKISHIFYTFLEDIDKFKGIFAILEPFVLVIKVVVLISTVDSLFSSFFGLVVLPETVSKVRSWYEKDIFGDWTVHN